MLRVMHENREEFECNWSRAKMCDSNSPLDEYKPTKLYYPWSPCEFDILLQHEIRCISLLISPGYPDVNDHDSDSACVIRVSENCKIQPAVETIVLKNKSTYAGRLLPLNLYERVPNLKKFYYFSSMDMVRSHWRASEQFLYLYHLTVRAEEALAHLKQIEGVVMDVYFFAKVPSRKITVEFWLNQLRDDQFFADMDCEVMTDKEAKEDEDGDFCLSNSLHRVKSPVLKCAFGKVKFFIFADIIVENFV